MLTTLHQLSMVHCQLGLADDSAQEAIWLHLGCAPTAALAILLSRTCWFACQHVYLSFCSLWVASQPAYKHTQTNTSRCGWRCNAWCRAALPLLQELQLQAATAQPPHGEHLLHRLVAGAAGSLRRLNLGGSAFSGDLSMLCATSALTWLDLSGATMLHKPPQSLANGQLRLQRTLHHCTKKAGREWTGWA